MPGWTAFCTARGMPAVRQGRLVTRAAEITGGLPALASHVGATEALLAMAQQHRLPLPDKVFLALVDIVLNDDIRRASADRRSGPRDVSKEDGDPTTVAQSGPGVR